MFLSLVLSQRQKELAVLQAIGASPTQIIRLVLFEILSIVMVSMILGIVLGVGLALSFNGFLTSLASSSKSLVALQRPSSGRSSIRGRRSFSCPWRCSA